MTGFNESPSNFDNNNGEQYQSSGPDLNSKINVFLSHKGEDEDLALSLRQLLCRYAGNRLRMHTMEDIVAGTEWAKWIDDSLASSNILLLLYTNPDRTWDWVMSEAGQFVGQQTPSDKKYVICLHHPGSDAPDPVRRYQTVPANEKSLKRWLKTFYGSNNLFPDAEPINEEHARDDEEIDRQAHEIASLFEPRKVEEMFIPHHLVLRMEDIDELLPEEEQGGDPMIPDTAEVRANDRTLADIFALGPGEYQWERLRERVSGRGDTKWLRELATAIVEASQRHLDVHLDQTFRAVEGGRIYRPLLYRVDFVDREAVDFHILFTRERAPKNVAGGGRMGLMFKLLQLGHRYRHEVLQTYKGKMADLAEQTNADVACRRLREVLEVIEEESEYQGLFSEDHVRSAFDDAAYQDRVVDILNEWRLSTKPEFEDSIEQRDLDRVEKFLVSIDGSTREFLMSTGDHYASVLKSELAEA